MKKIKQWLNRRRDRRLRKWCVKYGYVNGVFSCKEAKAIYEWVTSKQPQSHKELFVTNSTESKTIIKGGRIKYG